MNATRMTAGGAIVRTLELHGVERVFEVPGESFLDVLDGLHDASIRTVVCRQEGGAAFAAEAEAKLRGGLGVAMVTRGPGAANAMIGIHQAWQDSTPLLLFVGLVPIADRDRESFQEFDLRGWFGSTAKAVYVLDDPERASAVVADAARVAMSGRRGPVVIGLPEEVIRAPFAGELRAPMLVPDGAAGAKQLERVLEALAAASAPLVVVGGNDWDAAAAATLTGWLERNSLPAVSQWRANGIVGSDSSVYAGSLGYGRPSHVAEALDAADVVLTIGTVLGDVDTDGYSLRQRGESTTFVVTADADRLGHSGAVAEHLLLRPAAFVEAVDGVALAESDTRSRWTARLRAAYEECSKLPAATPARGPARMDTLFAHLVPRLPERSIVTMGAGNHTAWAHAYFPTRSYPSMISSRNGSMGYSVPAALAAALAMPDHLVVAVAGDGEFMMNQSELASIAQEGAAVLVVVMDNGRFGTIRDHQEHWYPERVSGTELRNPEFAKYAEAVGGLGIRVDRDDEVPDAVEAALHAVRVERRIALLHLVVDPAAPLPGA